MGDGGFTHDNVDNKSVDWYTPQWIFDELGLTFDLDPCAPPGGVPWIPAKQVYSLPQDGLSLPWHGRVWLNPPYGKHTKQWLGKMAEHGNGVALVFARTDCEWFHRYAASATALRFMAGRIKFVDGLGVTSNNGAGAGSMLIAWGAECAQALLGFNSGLFIDLATNRKVIDARTQMSLAA
jgi:hypothetical protein